MTDAGELLADLRGRGIRVDLDGDEIRLRATRGVLTQELVLMVRAIKPQVQALLVAEEAEIAWRAEALAKRFGDGVFPADLVVEDRRLEPGTCRSCGDEISHRQIGKCTLCCLASARIVLAALHEDATPKGGKW